VERLNRGLPPPDLRSLSPLAPTEFVEPPLPEKIPGETSPRKKIPGYATAVHKDHRYSLMMDFRDIHNWDLQ
jgi:hypothetical protein